MMAGGVPHVPYEPALLPRLVALWNDAFESRRNFYPVGEELYRRRILDQPTFDPGA